MIALVALSATGAQAGGGGMPSPLTGFFLCRSINGDDAGRRVDVVSSNPGSGWGFALPGVRIGNAILGCAFTKLLIPTTATEIGPNPGASFDQLKCYSVSVPRSQTGTPSPSYTVITYAFCSVMSTSPTRGCSGGFITHPL